MFVVDLIIAVLLGYSLFKGLQKGLIISLLSFIALLAGIYIALRFSFFARSLFIENTQWDANTITVASFFVTFMCILILIYILGKILTKVIDTLALGFINKIAGAIFEGVKMVVIISIFINIFQKINYNNLIVSEDKMNDSIFYHPIEKVSKTIFPLMDKWYKLALNETVEGIKEIKQQEKTTLE